MTASEQTWKERDPDERGVWWSEEENQFVCEATILSAMPPDLLEDHPTDDASYWNMVYTNIHLTLPERRQKAYCRDIILKLGKNGSVSMQTLYQVPSMIHSGFEGYPMSVFPEQYYFSPSAIGFHLGVDVFLGNPKTKHIIESSIASVKEGRFWTHYNPFELILINPDVSKVHRPKLGRRMYHQMLILGNHQGGYGSCFMPHERIVGHVNSLLFNDIIGKRIPITDPAFVS